MKILLISIAFPPRNSPGALRPHSWAKYWSRAGHQVTVLTTQKELKADRSMISINQSTKYGYTVCEVGLGFTAKPKSKPITDLASPRIKKKYSARLLLQIHNYFGKILGPLYEIDLPFVPLLVRAGKILVPQENYDILVSTFSPASCHIVAHELKKIFGVRWVADYRDFWSGSDFAPGIWPFSTLGNEFEKKIIRTADLLMAVSEPMQQELIRRYDLPCVTVENGFDPEDYEQLDPKPLFPQDGKQRFIYTGAIYGKRDPEPFFAAVQELMQEGHLLPDCLEILFYGRRLENVSLLAHKYGIQSLVKIMGLVDRHIALRAQRDASGLLFLEGQDYTVDYVLPAKIFEFIRSGTPILGIGMNNNSLSGQFLNKSGTGYPLGNDVKEIKEFVISNYIKNKSPDIHPNIDFINTYSREKLAIKALKYLEKMLIL